MLTCASSRAIILELIPDMQVPSFIRDSKRFISRKGIPEIVIRDNLKTFQLIKVKRLMLQNQIIQKFILPAPPWCGDFTNGLSGL